MILKIKPHPKADLLLREENVEIVYTQLISELDSPNFKENRELLFLLRQFGFVNLWVFLKIIAAYHGPFEKLNTDLHAEMCNFRQETLRPGVKAAGFLGRKTYKTTIFTEGGSAWALLRNPDIIIAMFSAIRDRSMEFMHTIQRIFDSNELFQVLYPEYVPLKNQKRWNDVEIALPNRSKHFTDASITPHGICCSTAGIHPTHIVVDDPIGDTQLNANRQSSAEMFRIANWLKSNLRTLTRDENSSVFYTGTRYAVDDAHAFIFENVKEQRGNWEDVDCKVNPEHEWIVYFRKTREDGRSIVPEIYTEKTLDLILKEDPWTYWTQIQNSPKESGLSELNLYEVKECELLFENDEYWMRVFESAEEKFFALSDCDVVIACDPAATEKYISAKTSRTSVGVIAHHASDRRFLLALYADYVAPSRVEDWLFSLAFKFKDYFRVTLLEAQGAFKILGPILREAELRRKLEAQKKNLPYVYLHLRPQNKKGEKDAVIRSTLEPILDKGLLYAEKSIRYKLIEELDVFPQSPKKDILDMLSIGLNGTYRPFSEQEEFEKQEQDAVFANRHANTAGY